MYYYKRESQCSVVFSMKISPMYGRRQGFPLPFVHMYRGGGGGGDGGRGGSGGREEGHCVPQSN